MYADMIIQNAKIRTFDSIGSIAQSIAVMNGWIIGVGSNEDLFHLIGPETKKLDLEGMTVLPGFIDAHEHLSLFAEIPLQIDLSPKQVNSIAQLLEKNQGSSQGYAS